MLYKQPKYTSHVIEVSLSEIHLVMKTRCIYVVCAPMMSFTDLFKARLRGSVAGHEAERTKGSGFPCTYIPTLHVYVPSLQHP